MNKATEYAESVVNGKIIACKWVVLACKRYLGDVKTCEDRGFYFDQDAVDRVLKVFSVIKHTTGEWAGQLFELTPWQHFIVANVFGWKNDDGTRRFRVAYLETARKSGKTTLLAALGIYLFGFDGEEGAQVFSAASKRDQARLSHGEAKRMVQRSAPLKKRIRIFKDNLSMESTHSKFEPLAADANTMDGLNVAAALVDELHAHPNRDVWDILQTATGSRRQPLMAAITTAGFDKHSICWEQHEYTEKILEGLIEDDTHFGIIFTLDTGDDCNCNMPNCKKGCDSWQDESVWMKANPNLGICTKIEDLRMKAKKAKEVTTALNSFLRLHMNIWTESVTRWIPSDKWNACGGEIDEEKLKGRKCYGGLDLSTTTDISAFVLLFPPEKEGDKYDILCRFWIPDANMRERVRKDRVSYDVWSREGYVKATPGNIIDYSYILDQIDKDAQAFDLQEIVFDRWGSTKIIQDLQSMGFEEKSVKHAQRHLIDFGQGFASMSAPTKELEKMVIAEEINHGNNPVLAWMMSNVVIKTDPADNYKIDKAKSTEKVDGAVALVMAIARGVGDEDNTSKYEEDGILTL